MASWKKIHEWFVRALEEPFYRAEIHRVDMYLPEGDNPGLQLIDRGVKTRPDKSPVKIKRARGSTART